jgi:hypothetical protein
LPDVFMQDTGVNNHNHFSYFDIYLYWHLMSSCDEARQFLTELCLEGEKGMGKLHSMNDDFYECLCM